MEKEKAKTDSTHSRWQRITVSDVMCGFYWLWIFVTFTVITNIREDFNEYLFLDSLPKKIVFIFSSWLLTIAFFQTALGQKGYLKAILKWLMLPASIVRIIFGFMLDSRKTWIKLKNNFPFKRIILLSLPISYLTAFYFIEPVILTIAMYVIYFQLAFLIIWSFRWCVNPLKAFEGLKAFKEQSNKIKIISGIATSLEKGLNLKEQIQKKVEQLTKAFNALEYLSKKIGSTAFLLYWFLSMWGFVLTNVIVGSAGILRILHLTTVGGILEGKLFRGEPLDYIMISAFQFLGSDVHGVEIISRDALIVLGFLPFASLILLVVVITAFSMVAQSKFENAVLETHKELGTVFAQAVEELHKNANIQMQKDDVVLVAENGKVAHQIKVESQEQLSKVEIPLQ